MTYLFIASLVCLAFLAIMIGMYLFGEGFRQDIKNDWSNHAR